MRRTLLILVAGVLTLAGCGGSTDSPGSAGTAQPRGADVSTASPSTTGTEDTELVITVSEGPGGAQHHWRLTCSPPGGDHPDPEGACAALAAAKNPFAPVPKDQMCTQIYGGPQTATVTGTYQGQRVDAAFRLTDGCQISRWKAVQALLVIQGGVPGS